MPTVGLGGEIRMPLTYLTLNFWSGSDQFGNDHVAGEINLVPFAKQSCLHKPEISGYQRE